MWNRTIQAIFLLSFHCPPDYLSWKPIDIINIFKKIKFTKFLDIPYQFRYKYFNSNNFIWYYINKIIYLGAIHLIWYCLRHIPLRGINSAWPKTPFFRSTIRNPWPRAGLQRLSFMASTKEILQIQHNVSVKSRLPIPSRSRDGEGRPKHPG